MAWRRRWRRCRRASARSATRSELSALQNLGVAELWSSRLDDARRDLEQALALARRAGRPWLEIPCLGHLGIAGPWTGLTFSEGLELSEEAVRIADAHGWGEDPVIVTGLATGAMALLWLGRFDEAERWLERAERTLQPEGEPGTELIVHHARGLLRLAQGRFDEALAAFRAAERMQALLAGKHPFALRTRARLLQTQVRMGELAAARAAIAEISDAERGTSEMRIAAAVIHLADREPEQALDVLAPVIEGSAPSDAPGHPRPRRRRCSTLSPASSSVTTRGGGVAGDGARPGRAGGDRPAVHPRAGASASSNAFPGTARRTPRCGRRSSTCSPAPRQRRRPAGAAAARSSARPSCASSATCRAT